MNIRLRTTPVNPRWSGRSLPRGLPELLIPPLKTSAVREVDGATWEVDLLAVDLLEADDEHGAVR